MAGHGEFSTSSLLARIAAGQERSALTTARRARTSRGLNEVQDLDVDNSDRGGDAVDYMAGFRHLLPDDFGPDNAFKIDGKSPRSDTGGVERLRQLMARLAKRMDFEFDWPGGAAEEGLEAWENPEIPSGYTYLLQLVAHDIVSTSLSIAVLEGTTAGVRNARSGALRLDTIYDGGPAVCPIAFQPDDASGISRTALRLGSMKDSPGLLRDLARMPPPCSDAIALELAEPLHDGLDLDISKSNAQSALKPHLIDHVVPNVVLPLVRARRPKRCRAPPSVLQR